MAFNKEGTFSCTGMSRRKKKDTRHMEFRFAVE